MKRRRGTYKTLIGKALWVACWREVLFFLGHYVEGNAMPTKVQHPINQVPSCNVVLPQHYHY
jgi:hypothetical protein